MDRRAFLTSSLALTACATPSPLRESVPALELDVRLDELLSPFVASRDFSGVIIMERRGAVVGRRAFGAADLVSGRPNTPDTRYGCASVGKLFTRATIVALEREGRLSQDDAFARFAPDFPNAENFTIRQLIEHRAGISRDLTLGDDIRRRLSTEELARRIASMPTVGAPGERRVYSNNGYRLLAYAIERAGGGDYGELVRSYVLEPREMHDTGEISLAAPVANLATGYVAGRGLGTLEPALVEEQINYRGAGSFYSTPNDLLRFARSLPIMASDLERAVPAQANGQPGRLMLGHDGLGHGYANVCFAFPREDARLVMMGNIQTGIFNPLQDALVATLFNEPATPLPLPPTGEAPLDLQRAQALVGNYELFPGTPLIVRVQGEVMEVSAGGDDFAPLIPLGADRFFMRQRFATLTFQVSGSEAESVLWAESGSEFQLRRLQ